ncbi:MAG: hypothetical protein V1800_05705 [Candidatus Latescibacterota bacterium]
MVKLRMRNQMDQVEGDLPVWVGLGNVSSRSVLSTGMRVEQVQAARQEGGRGITAFPHTALTDEDPAAPAELGRAWVWPRIFLRGWPHAGFRISMDGHQLHAPFFEFAGI